MFRVARVLLATGLALVFLVPVSVPDTARADVTGGTGGAVVAPPPSPFGNEIVGGPVGGGPGGVVCKKETGEGVLEATGEVIFRYPYPRCFGFYEKGSWDVCTTGYDVFRFYGTKSNPVVSATFSRANLRRWCLPQTQSRAALMFPNPWDVSAATARSAAVNNVPSVSGYDRSIFSVRSTLPRNNWNRFGDEVVGSFTSFSNLCLPSVQYQASRGGKYDPDGGVLAPDCLPTSGEVVHSFGDCGAAMPPLTNRLGYLLRSTDPEQQKAASVAVFNLLERVRALAREVNDGQKERLSGRDLDLVRFAGGPTWNSEVLARKYALGSLGFSVLLASPTVAWPSSPETTATDLSRLLPSPDSCATPINYVQVQFGPSARGAGSEPLLGMCVASRGRVTWGSSSAEMPFAYRDPKPGSTSWVDRSLQYVRERYNRARVTVNEANFVTSAFPSREALQEVKSGPVRDAYANAVERVLTDYVRSMGAKWEDYLPGGYWYPRKGDVQAMAMGSFNGETNPMARKTIGRDAALVTLRGPRTPAERELYSGPSDNKGALRCYSANPSAGVSDPPCDPTDPSSECYEPEDPDPTDPCLSAAPPAYCSPVAGPSAPVQAVVRIDPAFWADGEFAPRSISVTSARLAPCTIADKRLCPELISSSVTGRLAVAVAATSSAGLVSGVGSYRRCAPGALSSSCDYAVTDPSTGAAPVSSPAPLLGQSVRTVFFAPTPEGVALQVGLAPGATARLQTKELRQFYIYPPCPTKRNPGRTCRRPDGPPRVVNGPIVTVPVSAVAENPVLGLTRKVYGSVGAS